MIPPLRASGLILAAAALVLGGPGRASAQDSVVVALQSRRLTMSHRTTVAFLDALRASPSSELHGLAYLRTTPRVQDRLELARRGLLLVTLVHGRVYIARASSSLDIADTAIQRFVGMLAALELRDRVAPDIWEGRLARFALVRSEGDTSNWVRNRDGTLRLTVSFAPGTPVALARSALQARAQAFSRISDTDWRVVATPTGLRALAALDRVLWIDGGSPPFVVDNDVTRQAIEVDPLQTTDPTTGQATGLVGAAIQVGVFDAGLDDGNNDFMSVTSAGLLGPSRVIAANAAATWHGTLVAGIIAGNGWQSDKNDSWGVANGGSSHQWRGMAPAASLLESAPIDLDGFLNFDPAEVLGFIQNQGMDLSNHSYSFDYDGYYSQGSAKHDALIRGDEFVNGQVVPARLEVFSAGNDGADGYFSLTKELKNALIVGDWYWSEARLSRNSSLGPTYDGRIKPEVVAPGTYVRSTAYLNPVAPPVSCTDLPPGVGPGLRRNFYGVDCGTSLAAPTVTGMLALVLQQYAATYATDIDDHPPLPSTLRGIAINSASDRTGDWLSTPETPLKGFPGPDFATGFGIVNAPRAVELVERRAIWEGSLDNTCDVQVREFQVDTPYEGAEPESVKVTLVWDDPANAPVSDRTLPRLVNDLDLVLIDPTGARHYPWLLDQTPLDANDTHALTIDEQTCGTAVLVQRQLSPFVTIQAADLKPAVFGKDHLNNVEHIVAEGIDGTWRVEVSGFRVGMGPQRFSVVGVPTQRVIRFHAVDFCKTLAFLCRRWLVNVCARYPLLCQRPQIIPFDSGVARVTFRSRADRAIIPLRLLCRYSGIPDGCQQPGVRYEMAVGETPSGLTVEVYSSRGSRVAGDGSPRQLRQLAITAQAETNYVVVLGPSARAPIGTEISVPITVRLRKR